MEPFRAVVYGKAQPTGSKSAAPYRVGDKIRVSVRDSNPKSRPWMNQIAQEAGRIMAGRELFDGPLSALFRFVIPRPKGHYRKNGELSASGRRNPHPAKRPDALKLARGAEDALSGVVYRDDSQIVDERLVKEWGEPARVEIEVRQIDGEPRLPASEHNAIEF